MNESNPTSHKMNPEYGFLSERGIHPENILNFHILYVWTLPTRGAPRQCKIIIKILHGQKV